MSEEEMNAVIAANIEYYMQLRDISRADIAKYLNVSTASVSNWLNGIKLPRVDKIDKLCELFRCKRSDLISKHDEENTADALQHAFDDRPEMHMLFSVAKDASKEDIEKAIKIIQALKGE